MSKKLDIVLVGLLLLNMTMPVLAATNITSAKDLIGDPIQTFNGLPDSTRSGIVLITGLVFLGCLLAVIYAILINTGKTTLGTTSHDAKMRSDGVTGILTIAGVVILAFVILGFVFWYFSTSNI